MKKIVLITVLLATFGSGVAFAGSVAGTGGATEVTQWQNMSLLGKQLAEMKQQYDQMLLQTQSLTRQLNNPMNFGQTEQTFRQLYQLAQQTSALSYANQNVDAQFRAHYPGYESELVRQMRTSGQVPTTYSQSMETLHSNSMQSIQSAMAAAGFQANQMQSEADMLAQLRARSNSATGQLQAQQAGNQINAFIADELRRQRQLNMSMAQQQTTWMQYQAEKEVREKEMAKTNIVEASKKTNEAVDKSVAEGIARGKASILKLQ